MASREPSVGAMRETSSLRLMERFTSSDTIANKSAEALSSHATVSAVYPRPTNWNKSFDQNLLQRISALDRSPIFVFVGQVV